MSKVISAQEAAKLIKDNDVIAATTMGLATFAEEVVASIEERYLSEHHPKDITFIHACGIGNGQEGRGSDHLAHEGLIKRLISGHTGSSPRMANAVAEGKIEAYLLPQGTIAQIYRSTAGRKPGVITKVGLGTYVDPRLQGARVTEKTGEDIIEVIEMDGEEWLRYKNFPVTVGLIRGTTADENGNLTSEEEVVTMEALALATAVKNNGGIVIAQVKNTAEFGSLHPKRVTVPGALIDYVVVGTEKYHMQTMGTQYNKALTGDFRVPVNSIKPLPLDARKVIARRAAMELVPNAVINLGIGMPDGIANVAAEEGVADQLTMTLELGVFGGVPATGLDFGAAYNAEAIVEHTSMFDFYDGGGLDTTFLGSAQMDRYGNVNVSQFGKRAVGPGGFINISQNSKKAVFMGTFTVGSKATVENGKLVILNQGKAKKFLEYVEQVTFSGIYASENNLPVLFVTERAVFDIKDGLLRLIEIAPGVDLKKDILEWMDFTPLIAEDLKVMDKAIFQETWGGLKDVIESKKDKVEKQLVKI
ncbi:malonate decarboxylase subunit alpha [Bacillus sp. V3B]|uniref:acyl CoA:acetate/3-ketoacid CoA transferase n=1 Tax=Bacillus sp. V3B TaxID=2804915 RepID=UPI00210C9859|nr:malonate decarboxylase subunit alpha [Bacillus sp. V3B]MCQ6275496.1 malonate decarboxylase subunit alpha [Bacillus sp. V3B]